MQLPSTPTNGSHPVAVIGGGIGGLAMANALRCAGVEFALFEQAPAITEVGAGIGLSRGTLELLDLMGLGDEIRESAAPVREIYLADRQLNIRRKLPAEYQGSCIHRATLVDVLRRGVPEDRIHLSHRVRRVLSFDTHAEVEFENGHSITTDCLIAADGIHSAVRRSVFPEVAVRYIDQTIWRGITTKVAVPDWMQEAYIEIWDQGLRFLTVPIRLTGEEGQGEGVFWLAVKPAPPGETDHPETAIDDLLRLFGAFHPLLKDLVKNTETLIRNDMGDLGPPRRPWHHKRVVFIGDAIHATTPNLAQGGCQAIEDAVCLAQHLARAGADLDAAFRAYQKQRQRKVSFVVNTSWRFGRGAHSPNRFVHGLARAALERAPGFLLARQERFLSDVGYLTRSARAGVMLAG